MDSNDDRNTFSSEAIKVARSPANQVSHGRGRCGHPIHPRSEKCKEARKEGREGVCLLDGLLMPHSVEYCAVEHKLV